MWGSGYYGIFLDWVENVIIVIHPAGIGFNASLEFVPDRRSIPENKD